MRVPARDTHGREPPPVGARRGAAVEAAVEQPDQRADQPGDERFHGGLRMRAGNWGSLAYPATRMPLEGHGRQEGGPPTGASGYAGVPPRGATVAGLPADRNLIGPEC